MLRKIIITESPLSRLWNEAGNVLSAESPADFPRLINSETASLNQQDECSMILSLSEKTLQDHASLFEEMIRSITGDSRFALRVFVFSSDSAVKESLPLEIRLHLFSVLPLNLPLPPESLKQLADSAFYTMNLLHTSQSLRDNLVHSREEVQRLTSVGQSLTSEKDFDTLIGLILDHAREIVGADSGSIYVVDRKGHGARPTHLRFKKSLMVLDADEFLLPINKNSIAGYVAFSGEPLVIENAYELSGEEEFRFNRGFDETHNYYSKSMMVIPMKNYHNKVIGVIQLINRKRNPELPVTVEQMRGDGVIPFSERDLELAMALAGQAAVAIENNQLLADISNLFEGFVRASVSAIEQRDPTTSGHSFRVADLCVGMAQAVNRSGAAAFGHTFSDKNIRELRYAALLHDFGKVGVREKVLVKEKKLYAHEMEIIEWRFRYIKKTLEVQYLRSRLEYLKKNGNQGFDVFEKQSVSELISHFRKLDAMLGLIKKSDEPTVMPEGASGELRHIAKNKIIINKEEIPFLYPSELISLSVSKGNLNEDERSQIMLHVTNTYNFLIQIPWTDDLAQLPEIALSHHEKLNGDGYPFGLEAPEISLQTRIMTIADIYDALTAVDRPYKKGVAPEKALDILRLEVKDQHIDERLLNLFTEAEVYKLIKHP